MLRWLRSPHPAWRPCPQRQGQWLINLCLLLIVLLASAPAQADAPDAHAPQRQPQQQPQQLSPVQVVLVPGQPITVSGVARPNQSPQYIFNASAGQRLSLSLTSQGTQLATFRLLGVLEGFPDVSSRREWSEVLTITQDYLVTVSSAFAETGFTLEITYGAQPGQPERIPFPPGQTSAERRGTTVPPQNPQFIFSASAGQTLRVFLSSVSGQANFSVRGVIDNQIYKAETDPRRDWSQVLTFTQDYLVTLVSPFSTNFTLQIFLSAPTNDERINFIPGENTAVRSGSLPPNVQKTYVFFAAAGRSVRLLLGATPAGSANFSLVGVVDNFIYKQPSDPAREWNLVTTIAQDYRITLISPVAANYTLEVTVPQPPTVTPTPATPVPTVPAGCTFDTIQNGGFEVDGFWLFGDSPVLPAYNSTVTHTPLRSMRLGIDSAMGGGVQNHKAFSSIRQPFQIPMTASIAQLRWWNFYRTEEGQTDTPGIAEDKQQVVLLNPDLTTVAVLRSVRRNTNIWQEEMVDLTPYRGRPLLLYFNVYNDGNGLRTWQYLDDVVVVACHPETTATPFAPTPVPTQFPTMVMPTVVATIWPTLTASLIPTMIVPSLASTLIGDAFLNTPAANGEPVVIELPPPQQGAQIAALPARIEVQPTFTPQPPVSQASLRLFDRPVAEVLRWIAIMLGALAVIGILVAVIWQTSSRRDSDL